MMDSKHKKGKLSNRYTNSGIRGSDDKNRLDRRDEAPLNRHQNYDDSKTTTTTGGWRSSDNTAVTNNSRQNSTYINRDKKPPHTGGLGMPNLPPNLPSNIENMAVSCEMSLKLCKKARDKEEKIF